MNFSSQTPAPGHLSGHLSDDTLDDVLIGAAEPADTAHLAACEACNARLEEFRSSLAMFNHASATWSQARSNTISRVLTPRRSTAAAAAWSLASAAVLSVALTLMVGVHRDSNSPLPQAVTDRATTSDQEIASDNAMLHAIDSELSRPVSSPIEVSMQKTGTTVSRQHIAREVRN